MGVTVAAAVVIAYLPCSSELAFGASVTFKIAPTGGFDKVNRAACAANGTPEADYAEAPKRAALPAMPAGRQRADPGYLGNLKPSEMAAF